MSWKSIFPSLLPQAQIWVWEVRGHDLQPEGAIVNRCGMECVHDRTGPYSTPFPSP